jgi:hypothetical protein
MNLCKHPEHVRWNRPNGVVQCHKCGHVWTPLNTDAGLPYAKAVAAEQQRLNGAQLHPANYKKDCYDPFNGDDPPCLTRDKVPFTPGMPLLTVTSDDYDCVRIDTIDTTNCELFMSPDGWRLCRPGDESLNGMGLVKEYYATQNAVCLSVITATLRSLIHQCRTLLKLEII